MAEAPDTPLDGTTDNTILDWSHLHEMAGGDQEFVQLLLTEYRTSTIGTIQRIGEAIQTGDRIELRAAAHALKGSSRTIGARALAKESEDMERLALEGMHEQWTETQARINQAWSVFQKLTSSID